MTTKTSVIEIQNLFVNPESQAVKSNSESHHILYKYVSS